jgi:flagellar L-ring protein precursor FlgH
MRFPVIFLLIVSIFQASCSSTDTDNAATTDFDLYYPETPLANSIVTGSIFDNGNALYPTRRMYMAGQIKVGDLITVVLNESAQASRNAGLTAERTSANDVLGTPQANALFPAGEFYQDLVTTGSSLSSDGTGTARQSASLTGSISAVVVDVMDNGNLIIVGEKRLTLSEGSEIIRVKGVVRPEDIQPNNTVNSRRIANAQISYSGNGELARAVKPAWGMRVLFGLWPF